MQLDPPRHTGRLLLATFIASFAVISVERAAYFFTSNVLGFSNTQNLLLALGFGVTYVIGSLTSHKLARRFGEKRMLMAVLVLQAILHTAMASYPVAWMLCVGNPIAGLLYGSLWPLFESYVAAGRSTRNSQRTIGLFNLAWSPAIPLNLLIAGFLMDRWPSGLFAIPAVLNVLTILLLRYLPDTPPRLADDHPHRPPAAELARLGNLVRSYRWLLFSSYVGMFLIAPLMPAVFHRLGREIEEATAYSGLLDLSRFATFALLFAIPYWHGRRWVPLAAGLLVPAGFFLTLFGATLEMVLVGEVLFGIAAGTLYYGALYYALLVSNAAVDAGGAHESLIGGGFALGPIIGLLSLQSFFPNELFGTVALMAPLYLLTGVLAIRSIRTRKPAG